jgi:hypothetical protein
MVWSTSNAAPEPAGLDPAEPETAGNPVLTLYLEAEARAIATRTPNLGFDVAIPRIYKRTRATVPAELFHELTG